MTSEKDWMSEIIDPFFSGGPQGLPSCIQVSSGQNIEERYQVLLAGYGIRTFKVLSSNFPRFAKYLGEAQWHSIGRGFSMTQAMKEPQLGLLPELFYNWSQSLDLAPPERHHLEVDWAAFRSKQKKYRIEKNITELGDLATDPILRLQDSLITLPSEKMVVSRDQQKIFEVTVEETTLSWLLKIADQNFKLTDFAEENLGEQALAKFLQLAVTNHWFYGSRS